MAKSLANFSLLSNREILGPCMTLGDKSFCYIVNDDFNKWFFSKIGFLLINDYNNILLDKILFTLLGGSDTWLSLLSKKITINKFRTDNAVYEDFIKAISSKIMLSKGFNTEYSDKFDAIKIPDDFEQVLSFYYKKYIENPHEKVSYDKIPSPYTIIKSSKNHNGLYTIVRVDNNIYNPGNTLHFNQRPQAEDSLLLVYFFSELFENNKICETIRGCLENKKISSYEQKTIEIFIKEMDK